MSQDSRERCFVLYGSKVGVRMIIKDKFQRYGSILGVGMVGMDRVYCKIVWEGRYVLYGSMYQ